MNDKKSYKTTYSTAAIERNVSKTNESPALDMNHFESPDMFLKTGRKLYGKDEDRMCKIRREKICHPRGQKEVNKGLSLKNSSIYVSNRIGNSETIARKIFWGIIFTICITLCVTQMCQFLTSYFGYPVVVDIETKYDESLEFPGVTICNLNLVRKEFVSCILEGMSYKDCLNLSHSDESKTAVTNDSEPVCTFGGDLDIIISAALKLASFVGLFPDLDYDSRKWYGHEAADLIKQCSINKHRCDEANFQVSLSNHYGNCFTFKPDKDNAYSTFPGPQGGLELEIDLEIPKYATMPRMFQSSAGVRVQIHDPHTPHNVDDKGIVLGPGSMHYISVTKSVFSRLPSPYKDKCRDYGTGGSQHICIENCLHELTTKECFCSTMKNPHDGVKQCNALKESVFCCLAKYLNRSFCDCPLDCEDTVYNLQVSSSTLFTEKHIDAMTTNGVPLLSPCEKNQHSCLIVKVYFDSFEYSVFKQQPKYTFEQIVSQIGGLMGLWLGVSLIAVFELLESAMLMCLKRLKHM